MLLLTASGIAAIAIPRYTSREWLGSHACTHAHTLCQTRCTIIMTARDHAATNWVRKLHCACAVEFVSASKLVTIEVERRLVWSLFCVKITILNVTCKQQCNLLTSVFNVKICANFDAMWSPNMNVTWALNAAFGQSLLQSLMWSSL